MSQEKTHNFVVSNDEMKDTENMNQATVFRFKFTDELVSLITNFAKIHQYDDRESYKEAWAEWVDDQDETIYAEKERLKDIGYVGDIEEKMYKAGRYYFRNKSSHNAEKKERRKYIPTSSELINAMNEHIVTGLANKKFSPAEGFDDFCENYRELLTREIRNILNSVSLDADEMSKKIKKTYKNRYYIMSRK